MWDHQHTQPRSLVATNHSQLVWPSNGSRPPSGLWIWFPIFLFIFLCDYQCSPGQALLQETRETGRYSG